MYGENNKYIETLDYGKVLIRYNKCYTLNYVDSVEMCGGDFYEIYTSFNGELVAIKTED